jgi:hypothetical protein
MLFVMSSVGDSLPVLYATESEVACMKVQASVLKAAKEDPELIDAGIQAKCKEVRVVFKQD